MYQRFISARRDIPHEILQDFVVIDYIKRIVILAVLGESGNEIIVGIGQYSLNRDLHTADVSLAVRDQYQNHGLGYELLSYLTYLAKNRGLLGFTAEFLVGNEPVFRLFDKIGFDIQKRNESGVYEMKLFFNDRDLMLISK